MKIRKHHRPCSVILPYVNRDGGVLTFSQLPTINGNNFPDNSIMTQSKGWQIEFSLILANILQNIVFKEVKMFQDESLYLISRAFFDQSRNFRIPKTTTTT